MNQYKGVEISRRRMYVVHICTSRLLYVDRLIGDVEWIVVGNGVRLGNCTKS